MKHPNFTAERIAGFQCEPGKQQAIFWDGKARGLGLRVTASGAKSYIFETRLHGKSMRITIGDIRTWTIAKAQAEATRYKALVDQGVDPRRLLAAQQEKQAAELAAAKAQTLRNAVTLRDVWSEYVAERSALWSEHHIAAHQKIIQSGGSARSRSPKLTSPGPLAVLADLKLIDLTAERIDAWAKTEAITRPSSDAAPLAGTGRSPKPYEKFSVQSYSRWHFELLNQYSFVEPWYWKITNSSACTLFLRNAEYSPSRVGRPVPAPTLPDEFTHRYAWCADAPAPAESSVLIALFVATAWCFVRSVSRYFVLVSRSYCSMSFTSNSSSPSS